MMNVSGGMAENVPVPREVNIGMEKNITQRSPKMPIQNDVKKSNKEKYVEEKARILLSKTSQYMRIEEEAYFEQYFKDFIRTIINDCKAKVSKEEIEEMIMEVDAIAFNRHKDFHAKKDAYWKFFFSLFEEIGVEAEEGV